MALACDMLSDRWTMLILREAFYGVSRFEDLRADLGIPRGILSTRLGRLVAHGILKKHPYRESNARIRHEYRLTDVGQELGLPLIALMEWGDRHLQDQPPRLRLVEQSSGDVLQAALVNSKGLAVARENVRIEISKER